MTAPMARERLQAAPTELQSYGPVLVTGLEDSRDREINSI